MKYFFSKISVLTASFLLALLVGAPVSAYTGVYVVSPTVAGGPEHVTVENFDLETNEENNYTDSLYMGLNYVESITITTNGPVHQHVLIKEYPEGSDQTFDIIVPQPVQDALISATVTIWAPDVETLLVRHEHKGAPTTYEPATKVQPVLTNEDGNVLWTFTVSSFSSFTFMQNEQTTFMKSRTMSFSAMLSIGFLALTSIAAPLALRRN